MDEGRWDETLKARVEESACLNIHWVNNKVALTFVGQDAVDLERARSFGFLGGPCCEPNMMKTIRNYCEEADPYRRHGFHRSSKFQKSQKLKQ